MLCRSRGHRPDGCAQLRPHAARDRPEPERGGGAARLVARERSFRLGAGLTYTEAMSGELAELLPALAEASRTVGSPQIRNRGTIGGNLATSSPAGDALPPLAIEDAEIECVSRRGSRRSAARVRHGRQAQCARRGRADRGRVGDAVPRATDVHEGRSAKCDGDRGRLAGGFGRGRVARVVRLRGLRVPWSCARRGRGASFPSAWPRRQLRSTTCAGLPPTDVTHCAC